MSSNSDGGLKLGLSISIFVCGIAGVLTPRLLDPFGAKLAYFNLTACGVIISAAFRFHH